MRRALCCWLAPAAFILDRLTKRWAMAVLPGAPRPLWPGVLGLTYVENTGAAFGMLQGGTTLLAILTGVILTALLVGLIWFRKKLRLVPWAGFWLLIGGALGNFVDRVLHGYVVDFIQFQFFRFPVFNVADICVCAAFLLIAGWILFAGELVDDAG